MYKKSIQSLCQGLTGLMVTAMLAVLASCQQDSSITLGNQSVQVEHSAARTAAEFKVPSPPKKLCIYYSWPSVINSSNGDVNKAVNQFVQFDIVVLGDGLWKTSHGDNSKTKQIITLLRQRKPSIKIYGYIDVGVKAPAQNLSDSKLKEAIDGWKMMGATGVFGDDFGTDFGVYRQRQNVFIDYAHSKGMSVFANSWSVNDALGGTDCKLDVRDFYLLESFCVGHGAYRSLNEFKQRGDLALFYMKQKQVGIAAVATTTFNQLSANTPSNGQFLQSWYGTAMYNFDAFQFTDKDYSASVASGSNGKVFVFNNPISSYGTSWKEADWIVNVNPTLYRRSTNSHTLYISGNGKTTGTGYITKP